MRVGNILWVWRYPPSMEIFSKYGNRNFHEYYLSEKQYSQKLSSISSWLYFHSTVEIVWLSSILSFITNESPVFPCIRKLGVNFSLSMKTEHCISKDIDGNPLWAWYKKSKEERILRIIYPTKICCERQKCYEVIVFGTKMVETEHQRNRGENRRDRFYHLGSVSNVKDMILKNYFDFHLLNFFWWKLDWVVWICWPDEVTGLATQNVFGTIILRP